MERDREDESKKRRVESRFKEELRRADDGRKEREDNHLLPCLSLSFRQKEFFVVISDFPDIVINVVTLLSASTALKWRLTEVSCFGHPSESK